MSTPPDPLLDALRACVGAPYVLAPDAPPAELEPFERDWRGRERGRARAVVRPGSTAEVVAVVRACAAAGAAIVPQGGNTGLVPVSYTHLTLPTKRIV